MAVFCYTHLLSVLISALPQDFSENYFRLVSKNSTKVYCKKNSELDF